jgi:adenine C2-methylase RlmN of 23S rRNA A2503 and tRNA A37
MNFKESSMKDINMFKEILENWGLTVTVRDSLGREARGACGQLWYEKLLNN